MGVPSDWWRTFFTGAPVDLWLRMPSAEQTRGEADLLEKLLRLRPGAKVLDVPCGGGRHALALAARGYEVTGVDLSADFLTHARKDAVQRGLTVDWHQREMRDLPWPGELDAAYCLGNSFGYLQDGENADFLRAVARCLKPGARLVIELGTVAESALPAFQERRWYQVEDILFLVHNRYDLLSGRLETECTFIRDGQTDRRCFSQSVYTYRELVRMLGECGFGGAEGHGGVNQEPYRLGSPRLFLVATRGEG
jgi:SAM-dependent methyltransferase